LNFYETAKITTRAIKNPILTLHVSSGQCKTMDINQTLSYLVTAGSDGIVSFWSTINLYCKNSFAFSKQNFTVNKLTISSDGKYIAFQGEDQKILIVSKSKTDQIEVIFKITTKAKKTCMKWNPKYRETSFNFLSL